MGVFPVTDGLYTRQTVLVRKMNDLEVLALFFFPFIQYGQGKQDQVTDDQDNWRNGK